MLETPKSAKTPSTPGIPNSCTTSAILENDDSTNFTVVPNFFSRSAASAIACASWSRLINFPDVSLDAMAAEWPPAPNVASMYVPSGFTSSHSSTSSSSTGTCGSLPLPTAPHPIPRKPPEHNFSSSNRRASNTPSVLRATARRALSQSRIVYLARPLSCWPDFVLHTQSCQFITRKWLILHLIDQPGVIHDHQDV